MKNPLSNPRFVAKTPLLSFVLIEGGALGQIARMLREGTAAGQNLWSWIAVAVMLCFWFNYYRVMTPKLILPRFTAGIGVVINLGICATIVFFRYVLGNG